MMQRAPRYPPSSARLIRLEEGPPMYRMLGYADRGNLLWDLTEPTPPGYHGPFSVAWPENKQSVHVGPGRFGLPSQPLAYTTLYWDDNVSDEDKNLMQTPHTPFLLMNSARALATRPAAEVFPEMAVPGSGVMSKFRDSGYIVRGV
ncbi:hypothetical protein ElyMa_002157200 [Elysia marginata]|uniref:Uncharacterized protein n=1 Tax=Elysia marginata TaxID=1093978 RepID=A0AAV4FMN8_9GAST|nr:hypothetical protein ElyMa_002157200 [Elysia marginata]